MSKPIRMYSDYFGIRENAFAITPDPRYLFMSDRHREALAHLLFGTEEGGGFVQLTGEVGTGKTTICRAFLEQLPENVDVALLLNPPENGQELLLAIASELRLPVPKRSASVRELVDILNSRLLESHAEGRRTVVIIDEAQNILPEVLEQVRLLTNLETPTHKLLQVFLIGQPELREKLKQPGLRQVAQRITARYHLQPLSLKETRGYIQHRLMVAGCRQGLFSPAAIKQIFLQSQGIPRVINILCDRSLLGAFATNKAEVSDGIVRYAAKEWRGQVSRGIRLPPLTRPVLAVAVAGLMVAAAAGYSSSVALSPDGGGISSTAEAEPGTGQALSRSEPGGASKVADGGAAVAEPPHAVASAAAAQTASLFDPLLHSVPTPETDFPELMQVAIGESGAATVSAQLAVQTGTQVALQALLARWGIQGDSLDRPTLCETVSAHGLSCLREKGGWDKLRSFNRPALLTLTAESGKTRYLTLVGMNKEHALVATSQGVRQVPYRELESYWGGEFVLLWHPPIDGVSLIGEGSSPWAIAWLHRALKRIDGQEHPLNVFDHTMEDRLRSFQQSQGLLADGIAGPRTLIHLNSLMHERELPMLVMAQANQG